MNLAHDVGSVIKRAMAREWAHHPFLRRSRADHRYYESDNAFRTGFA